MPSGQTTGDFQASHITFHSTLQNSIVARRPFHLTDSTIDSRFLCSERLAGNYPDVKTNFWALITICTQLDFLKIVNLDFFIIPYTSFILGRLNVRSQVFL